MAKSRTKLEATLKLLTPELKTKVRAKQEECYLLAEEFFKRKFARPAVSYDIKNHDGGRANSRLNLIRYNLILLIENEKDFLDQIVPHEVAHLINRAANKPAPGKKKLMPHGAEWKHIMSEVFKRPPLVTHSYDCSSIEKKPRQKREGKARVTAAMQVIVAVLKRVEKQFTAQERASFKHQFQVHLTDIEEGLYEEAA